jgi:hypothetical protein
LAIPTGSTAAEFGYAMFLPSTAAETLGLTITTTKSTGATTTTKTAKIYEKSSIYVITIKFQLGGGIDVDATAATGNLQQWSNGEGIEADITN